MGITSSIFLATGIAAMIKLHREIGGQWWAYWRAKRHVRKLKKKPGRFDIFDVMKRHDARAVGLLVQDKEWELERPSKSDDENLFVYGSNSDGQSVRLDLKWRPRDNSDKAYAVVHFAFQDADGATYTLDEDAEVANGDNYRVAGLGFDILQPHRRLRLTFRGYLKKNGGELVFVRIRLLWLVVSKVHDFLSDFDEKLLVLDMLAGKGLPTFEDRYEQLGQLKGTVQIESDSAREVALWGTKAKKFLPKTESSLRMTRLIGYGEGGVAFHVGFVEDVATGFVYRYGFGTSYQGPLPIMTSLSLKSASELTSGDAFEFSFKFPAGQEFLVRVAEDKATGQGKTNGQFRDFTVSSKSLPAPSGGKCFVSEEVDSEWQRTTPVFRKPVKAADLVVSLAEEAAKNVELTGGKGASLAHLLTLSRQEKSFTVPPGVVVTTNAYALLTSDRQLTDKINVLQKQIWSESVSKKEKQAACEKLVAEISETELPEKVKAEIDKKLTGVFGDYSDIFFAVRSSASGEDSEEMSAAGQMTTFLGVKGSDAIYRAVAKCWASQFGFVAAEYKHGYGQLIDQPMAVVVQEMIACDAAGVIFTCDLMTGDERHLVITANYGLGESVVAAAAEPDTIRVGVSVGDNSLKVARQATDVEKVEIGSKKKLIRLAAGGGTEEVEGVANGNACISKADALRLADIALRIHHYYGGPRDIEWGVKDGRVVALQSRPVTNLDGLSDYELMHEIDTSHVSEHEIYSRTHWGENFPGVTSWFTLTFTFKSWTVSGFRKPMMGIQMPLADFNPYLHMGAGGIAFNQFMFSFKTKGFGDLFAGYPDSAKARSTVLGFFGHEVEDEKTLAHWRWVAQNQGKMPLWTKLKMAVIMPVMMLRAGKLLSDFQKMAFSTDLVEEWKQEGKGVDSPRDLLDLVTSNFDRNEGVGMAHPACSFGSMIKNSILRSLLGNADDSQADADFNLLMSSCTEVVSAEAGNELKAVARAIVNKDGFADVSDEEDVALLREANGSEAAASALFRAFLKKHGHRGLKEMDLAVKPWGVDPRPVVKTIRMMLRGGRAALDEKTPKSIEEVMNAIKTQLPWWKRYLIQKWILPWCRTGVGLREKSKYTMVYYFGLYRKPAWMLAERMVAEGFVPDQESVFYLTIEEVDQLLKTRDPTLLAKVRGRKRVAQRMERFKFSEFLHGPIITPRNSEKPDLSKLMNGDTMKLTGTSVSGGVVKARVCVAEDLVDADAIQQGDVLVTYSTDIGWSPYFPLLSGIVTEIGGTISHGSVIAREFGIPCLVAVEGACAAFKTGEEVLLDAEQGFIARLS